MEDNSIYALKGTAALYEVLGVSSSATQREIRQAYYKLAIVYHPDKNADGSEVFKEICFAHGILSDPEQRAMYDSGILRGDLESKARAYDPTMDPNVELSPENLRVFVDRVRQEQEANRKEQSSFEKRRDEEMRRRAEFDARNPAFKAEYERARLLRQGGLTASTPAAEAATAPAKVLTSAAMLAQLQRDEDEGLYGKAKSSASSSGQTAAGAASMKRQMMAQYRSAQNESAEGESLSSSYSNGSAAATLRSRQMQATSLPFVKEQCQKPHYSETVSARVQAYANYDYRTFVESGSVDREELEGAIMADALGLYDRDH